MHVTFGSPCTFNVKGKVLLAFTLGRRKMEEGWKDKGQNVKKRRGKVTK
jgi:hypothetical protein